MNNFTYLKQWHWLCVDCWQYCTWTPNKLLEMTNLHQNSGLVGKHEQKKLLEVDCRTHLITFSSSLLDNFFPLTYHLCPRLAESRCKLHHVTLEGMPSLKTHEFCCKIVLIIISFNICWEEIVAMAVPLEWLSSSIHVHAESILVNQRRKKSKFSFGLILTKQAPKCY